ncbi:unnamed protein product [Coregonus sp. 'balchen']|nr:unnamed protein product [Coregonus sp. 'balchen']
MDMSEILESSSSDKQDMEGQESDEKKAPRVPFQALAMLEPDRVPSNVTTPPPVITKTLEYIVKEAKGKLNELGQRISAIENAQLQNKMFLKEQFTKEYMKAKGLKDDLGQPL